VAEEAVKSLDLGPIWAASDFLSPRAPGPARRHVFEMCTRTRRIGNTMPTSAIVPQLFFVRHRNPSHCARLFRSLGRSLARSNTNSSASRSVLMEWPSGSISRPYKIHWLPCQRSVTPRASTARRNVRMSSEGVFLIVARERSAFSFGSRIRTRVNGADHRGSRCPRMGWQVYQALQQAAQEVVTEGAINNAVFANVQRMDAVWQRRRTKRR
jgi:hypothetical protein